MRKAAILVAGALAISPLPASADQPGAFAAAEQGATADWVRFKDKDTAVMYFGIGSRLVSSFGDVGTYGAVGKGKCHVERDRHFTLIICIGSARMREIPFEDFEFDPALSSARLTVSSQGFDHTIDWTGRGEPGAGASAGTGGTAVYASAGLGRDARASGRVFGERMTERGWDSFAGLGYSAFAFGFVAPGRSIEFTNDGRVVVRVSYRLPR